MSTFMLRRPNRLFGLKTSTTALASAGLIVGAPTRAASEFALSSKPQPQSPASKAIQAQVDHGYGK